MVINMNKLLKYTSRREFMEHVDIISCNEILRFIHIFEVELTLFCGDTFIPGDFVTYIRHRQSEKK